MGYRVRIHVELFPNVDFEYVFLDLTKILSVWSICWIYGHVITEDSKAESNETGEEITDLESDIQKEIAKLDYYTEQVDELIETEDYKEMKVINKQSGGDSEQNFRLDR